MFTKKLFLNIVYFLTLLLLIYACNNKDTKKNTEMPTLNKVYKTVSYDNSKISGSTKLSSCDSSKFVARNDFNLNKLRYYFFGMVSPSKKLTSILKEQYNIEARYMGCVMYKEETCYNEIVDSIMLAKTGKSITQLEGLK